VVVWTGTDPTPPGSGRGVSTIPVRVGFPTGKVKLYLDSPKFPGWNEIDAVGLEYGWWQTIWAAQAEASSFFGQNPTAPGASSYHPGSYQLPGGPHEQLPAMNRLVP
jgi:hypothetical protein